MADDRLRELERRWRSSGVVADEAAWLVERARNREVPGELLRAAAYAGHPAARLATGEAASLAQDWAAFDDLAGWAAAIDGRVGAAWRWLALGLVDALHARAEDDPHLGRVRPALEAWCLAPDLDHEFQLLDVTSRRWGRSAGELLERLAGEALDGAADAGAEEPPEAVRRALEAELVRRLRGEAAPDDLALNDHQARPTADPAELRAWLSHAGAPEGWASAPLEGWARHLARWGKGAVVRAALAAARVAGPCRLPAARRLQVAAIDAAAGYVAAPSLAAQRAAREAVSAISALRDEWQDGWPAGLESRHDLEVLLDVARDAAWAASAVTGAHHRLEDSAGHAASQAVEALLPPEPAPVVRDAMPEAEQAALEAARRDARPGAERQVRAAIRDALLAWLSGP